MTQTSPFVFSKRMTLSMSLLVLILSSVNLAADPLLNGVATHTELGKDQFIAGLYVSTLSTQARQILISDEEKRLQVRVLTPQLSTRRFKRMWIEGIAINSSAQELEQNAGSLAAFSNMLKIKMIEGDILSIDRSAESMTVAVNGTVIGVIDDPAFFDLLLRTWIGPVPLSSDFRADLLSEGEIKPESLARFEATRPSEERIAAIGQAVGARAAAAPKAASATVARPKLDVAAPKPVVVPPTGDDSGISVPDVALAAPQKEEAKPIETPKPKPKPVATPKPTPPPKIVLAPQQQALDESIFEADDETEFTAESLLREQLYYSQLAKFTHRFLKYPQRSFDKGEEGNVRVRVTIDGKGKVKKTEILEEAPFKALNNEAKKAVKRASPYPAIPSDLGADEYSFTFRIAFKLPRQ